MNTDTRYLHDTAGNAHTLAIGSVGIALDGKPCRLFVRDGHIDLISTDPDIGVVSVAPAALWQALAGDDPTAEDAGLIQAHALAGFAAMQEIAGLIGRLRPLLDEIDRHLHHFSKPPLPSYRFPPFVAQLLATLDGTEEQMLAVARVLRQTPETIQAWGAQMGTRLPLPPRLPSTSQDQQPVLCEEQADEQPVERISTDTPESKPRPDGRRGKSGYPWTEEHERLLEEAFDSSQQVSINARTREIAARFDWPFHVVDYRLRLLLGKRKAVQREAVTQPNAVENQVKVQPVTVTPEAIEVEQSSPASLLRGPFLWDVKVDGKLQRWQLDVSYGQFSHQAGTHFMYREQEYVLVRVWNSMIAVTRAIPAGEWGEERSAALQMATVSQRPRLLL